MLNCVQEVVQDKGRMRLVPRHLLSKRAWPRRYNVRAIQAATGMELAGIRSDGYISFPERNAFNLTYQSSPEPEYEWFHHGRVVKVDCEPDNMGIYSYGFRVMPVDWWVLNISCCMRQ